MAICYLNLHVKVFNTNIGDNTCPLKGEFGFLFLAITAIDKDILYKELGFEMYWEMYRRPQMIRFGKFDLAYTAKPLSQPFRRFFPILRSTIDVTKEFTQNQGYN